MDHNLTLNNRAAFYRNVKIAEKQFYNTILEADGFLLLIQDGQSVWYWLVFAPVHDYQQYSPTFVAMLRTIIFDGKSIDLESNKSAASPHPSPTGELTTPDIAKRSLQSVVLLEMQDSSGRLLKIGSGFFVGDNYCNQFPRHRRRE